ncbi:MAG: iron-sulfur cluster repair di-iron protein [Planctomycetes bacterium]|nr:iron-sulfur cluster repair di-iron protein [Planctomycetota bacterium]
MTTIDINTTVGDLVTQKPSRSRVFEDLGIDYCCGGKKPLAEVCKAKGLDPQTVLKVMLAGERTGAVGEAATDWSAAPLAALADHIEATHHAYLKRELPRLGGLVEKVARVHGGNHAELPEVARVFAALASEMTDHMAKEERVLFPMIRKLESSATRPSFHCGSIANPIRMMEMEHDSAGNALARLRELTRGYAAPSDACNTYRAMLDGLATLEADMHQHVHKENNILFPRSALREHNMVA